MSKYTCQNSICAIAISKAAFPVAMNCPVCQIPLEEKLDILELSPEDTTLINSLPYVIAYPLKRTLLESHPWTKINLLKDTFLNYLKYLGLLSASEFFNSDIKDKGMVALFHKNLMETAFGKWNHYIRECLAFLKQQNHTFFYPELVAYYELVETGSKSKKYKGEIEYQDANGDTQIIVQTSITSIGMLINFRNRYLGHGQTLDEVKSTELWNEYFPIFRHLLEQLSFTKDYPMLKHEHGETYLLYSSEIKTVESNNNTASNIWIENKEGQTFDILPFFIVPGEVSLAKEDKEQLLTYESYTGKTIKFFSPEGTEKQTSGKILEKLNLLLRDKQKETPFTPEAFTKDEFLKRIAEENKLLLDTLIAEKKIIPSVYQHREEMEIKLREWIGARANIFFIAAEAGSGKTNLLVEIQKQYTERELPSLLIRAGRMEKQSLKQQIAYLLNLDLSNGLENYTSIAGTQAQPTFILIDGLNEANNAEEIWQEIIELSKLFEPGSLKFIVTNRANTKVDLERYVVSDSENYFLYGENNDNEKGLSAYTYWLTALDMKEMKGAWENYVSKDKSRFKPLFSFEDIATFDRALYNQINNPLILRLFLEIYNGKALPKKGVKHLHVWQDWLKNFNTEEQTFLKLVADEIWLKGKNELLLDDLLKHEILKTYLASDIINAPYSRLKNTGWISRYVKDLNGYIGFTVEGALLYLLALQLQEQKPVIDLPAIKSLFNSGNKLQKSAIESFLCEQALNGDLNLVADLIDAGNDDIDLCIKPLLIYLKTFGVNATIEKVLENPTENDWKALLMLNDQLDELQLLALKSEFSNHLYNQSIKLCQELPLNLLLNILPEISYPVNEELLLTIEKKLNSGNLIKAEVIESKKILAYYCTMNGFPEKGVNLYNEIYNNKNIEDPLILNKIGAAYNNIGNKEEALKYYYSAREKAIKNDINNSKLLAQINFNLAGYQDNEIDKLKDYQNVFELESRIYGIQHKETARSISAIGLTYIKLNLFDSAFSQLNAAFSILNNVGADLEEIYKYFGLYYEKIKDYKNAIENYEKGFEIVIQKQGENGVLLFSYLTDISRIIEILGDDNKSLAFFEKAQVVILNSGAKDKDSFLYVKASIGKLNFYISKYYESIEYLKVAVDIHLNYTTEYTSNQINNIYYYLGYSYYCNGDYFNAEKTLLNLSKLNMKDISSDEYIDNFELIGNCFFYMGKYESAIESYKKIIPYYKDISAKFKTNKLIASCFENLNKYESAIEYYKQCLKIANECDDTLDLSSVDYRLGFCFQALKNYSTAISFFKNGFEKDRKDYFLDSIAKCYELLEQKVEALESHIKCSEIRKEDPAVGPEHDSTLNAIDNAIRLAKDLGKENELPEWMKNN